MKSLLPPWFFGITGKGCSRAPARKNRIRPQLESLEDRQLPAVILTDMTAIAQQFPRHSGPTTLYLNFDGWTDKGVSSFQNTTGNRTSDIHEILYRAAEIFSPFDVQVRRIYGNGDYSSSNGNSTIFIGDRSSNGTGTSNKAYAGTPWTYCDYPGEVLGIDHQPNSNPFDIAYVDPVSAGGSWSNLGIARAIGHEAGHTFGLGHVLSSPAKEMMSYDASNVRFINQTFNITDLNYNGTTTAPDPDHAPTWYFSIDFGWVDLQFPVPVATQNSYTYLQAVLGARSTSGDLANVADSTAVDASYTDGTMPSVTVGSNYNAFIQRRGDFDVFQLSTPSAKTVVIDISRYGTSTVDPVLMVYSGNGKDLLAFNDDRASGNVNSRLSFTTAAGVNYRIVVGSYGANSTGQYKLSISTPTVLVVSSTTFLNSFVGTVSFSSTSSNLGETAYSGAGSAGFMGGGSAFAASAPGRAASARNEISGLSDAQVREIARLRAQRNQNLSAPLDMAMALWNAFN